MSYDILTLVPRCYTKKSKKTDDFNDTDHFVDMLQKKFVEWNISTYLETKLGLAYKLKYDQLLNYFHIKCSIVLYVVDSSSEKNFRICIKKIISSCDDRDKLKSVIVVTINEFTFEEGNQVELVSFEGCLWRSEDDKWKVLENVVKDKLQYVATNNKSVPFVGTSLTLPLPITRHKSSSKILSFFNSLPSKFDIEKRRSFKEKLRTEQYNESVPNIKISGSQEENIMNEITSRNKEDHSKLSLSSIFRKRSRKARDSGLSMDSSNSNGSGSKKSEIMSTSLHEYFDTTSETSPTCERSPALYSSSLNKTKSYKAKLLIFKDKANKVFHSANCLNSPDNKRRKNVEDLFSDENQFSSLQIPMFTNIKSSETNDTKVTINHRGQSEPPICFQESDLDINRNGIMKYYSWNSDLKASQDILKDDLICSELKVTQANLEPTQQNGSCSSIFENNNEPVLNNVFDDFIEEDIQKSEIINIGNDIDEKKSENMNENYFQIKYAPNRENNGAKTTKHSVTFKIEGLDSLENIMDSIQKSCDEMEIKSKQNSENNIVLNTFKGSSENNSPNKKDKNVIINTSNFEGKDTKKEFQKRSYVIETKSLQHDEIQKYLSTTCENALLRDNSSNNSEIQLDQKGAKVVTSHSFLYRATAVILGNPFVVISLLTATAVTAPIWSTFIPYHNRIDQLYSLTSYTLNRALNSEIIRSFPARFLPTPTVSATATTKILTRYFIPSPQTNIFFSSFREIYG